MSGAKRGRSEEVVADMYHEHSDDPVDNEVRGYLDLLTDDDISELMGDVESDRSTDDHVMGDEDTARPDDGRRGGLRAVIGSVLQALESGRSDFLVRLAGTDAEVLDQSKERLAYSVLGLSLLAPFILASLGMTALLYQAWGTSSGFHVWHLLAGLSWGVVVVVIDRLLVRPRYDAVDLRSEGESRSSGIRPSVASSVVKIVIAVALAMVVAAPLVTMGFAADVDKLVAEEHAILVVAERREAILVIDADRDAEVGRREAVARRQTVELQAGIDRLVDEISTARRAHDDQVRLCQQEQVDGNGQSRGGGFGPVATELCAQVSAREATLRAIKASNDPQIAELQDRLLAVDEPITATMRAAEAEIAALPSAPPPPSLGLWERMEVAAGIAGGPTFWGLQGLVVLAHSLPLLVARFNWGRRAHDEILWLQSSQALTDQIRAAEALTDTHGLESTALLGKGLVEDRDGIPDAEPTFEVVAVGDRLVRITGDLHREGASALIRSGRLLGDPGESGALPHGVIVKSGTSAAVDPLVREIAAYRKIDEGAPYVVSCITATPDDQVMHPALILERYPRTSLDRWLPAVVAERGHGLPLSTVLDWLDNMVAALEALWTQGLVHGDGRPSHLLVAGPDGHEITREGFDGFAPGSLVLCGFSRTDWAGTPSSLAPAHGAPEYRSGHPLSYLGDVYSFLGETGGWILQRVAPGECGLDSAPPSLAQLIDRWQRKAPAERVAGYREGAPPDQLASSLRAQIDRVRDDLDATGLAELLFER